MLTVHAQPYLGEGRNQDQVDSLADQYCQMFMCSDLSITVPLESLVIEVWFTMSSNIIILNFAMKIIKEIHQVKYVLGSTAMNKYA